MRRLLFFSAIVVALVMSVAVCLRIRIMNAGFKAIDIETATIDEDFAARCYPFKWQSDQRRQLQSLLQKAARPPRGNDAMALARYAEYALTSHDPQVFREGMRRDPENALYHYLLADYYLNQAVTGDGPDWKKTGSLHYDYKVKDRRSLDLGMHELAIGMQLPYSTHRQTIVKAQLAAMPPAKTVGDELNQLQMLMVVTFPELTKIHNFARINGYYLSLLLSEGKRAQAEPFLHTGERLSTQLAQDNQPTLIGILAALAVSAICERNDAEVCREYGLTQEAQIIVTHNEALMGNGKRWKESVHHPNALTEHLFQNYTGIIGDITFPVIGNYRDSNITRSTLRPSRLLDYVLAEGMIASVLCTFFSMLFVFAGIRYWRFSRLAPDAEPVVGRTVSRGDLARVILIGFALPLVLYLLYIAIPALSGRDKNIHTSLVPFAAGLIIVATWMLLVPTTMAAGKVWQQGMVSAGSSRWRIRGIRAISSIGMATWALIASSNLLLPLGFLLLKAVAILPILSSTTIVFSVLLFVIIAVIPFISKLGRQEDAKRVMHHLSMAKTMATVYAAMTILTGMLALVCNTYERHFVATDRVTAVMNDGNNIAFSYAEGRMVLSLQKSVHEGAIKLGIPWQ